MSDDYDDDDWLHGDDFGDNRCDHCGGEGFLEYSDHPELWGEDCPSEVNHLETCPTCGGMGIIK